MSILNDGEITKLCDRHLDHPMIYPFIRGKIDKGVISFGLSSYGYDATLAPEICLVDNPDKSIVIDPKNFSSKDFPICVLDNSEEFIIPPHSFALGRTIEYFKIPRDVLAICVGKSTYARCGLIINVTPLEPEWEGHVTLELHNTTSHPLKVYGGEGICQFLFLYGAECISSYKDTKGKYQGQIGITTPKMK